MPSRNTEEEVVAKLCPSCGAVIHNLDYSCYQREYGTFTPYSNDDNDGDHEYSDSGDSDDYTYTCPECNNDIGGDWSSFESPPQPEEPEEESVPEPTADQIAEEAIVKLGLKPKPEDTENGDIHTTTESTYGKVFQMDRNQLLRSILICDCGESIMTSDVNNDDRDIEVECSHCGAIIEVNSYIKNALPDD